MPLLSKFPNASSFDLEAWLWLLAKMRGGAEQGLSVVCFFFENSGARGGAHDKKSEPPKAVIPGRVSLGDRWNTGSPLLPSLATANLEELETQGFPLILFQQRPPSFTQYKLAAVPLPPTISAVTTSRDPTSKFGRETDFTGLDFHSISFASREQLPLCSNQQSYCIIQHLIESYPANFPNDRTFEPTDQPATDQPIDFIDQQPSQTYLVFTPATYARHAL